MKLHKIFEITQSRPFPEFNFMQKYLEGFQYEVSVNEIDYGFPDIWISHNYDENGLLYPDYLFLAIGINFDANFRLPRSNKSYQVTGESIPLERRIGLLDRKLRVVSENVHESGEWLKATQSAFKSIYGYEWQGDNLFLAREALLYTFIDYYLAKFGKEPQLKSLLYIVYIISWNILADGGLERCNTR